MKVLIKLNEARKRFHGQSIKKTGRNTFAGYDYFELADFLVPAMAIFDELKLSGVVSFGVELATFTLTDLEDGSQFVITSPMSTANLKACHAVQNLGAVQTYIRRYLWVAALEIVEHDAIDSSEGDEERKPDAAAILRGIANSATLQILQGNFEAAISMLPKANHAQVTKVKDARKEQLMKDAK